MATSEHLTAAQLDALDRALRDTSPGDWTAGRYSVLCGQYQICSTNSTVEAEWIAAAHNAFPALLAMARRGAQLEAENARLERIIALDEKIEQAWKGEVDDTWRG